MATGYTAKLHDGEPETFKEFVWHCARAFGALVELRDDFKAPIPKELEPYDYHQKALSRAKEELVEAKKMTLEEAGEKASEFYFEMLRDRYESKVKKTEIRLRYEARLAEVKAWIPPSSEHQGLKDFMIEQIEKSIDFDCKDYSWETDLELESAEDYLARHIAQAEKDIEYHTQHWQEELDRTASRNAWIRELRNSIGNPLTAAPSS